MKTKIVLTPRDFTALSKIAKRTLLRAETQDSPFVAIPIPGQVPFILKRRMVHACMSGLKLTKVNFTDTSHDHALGIPKLSIAGVRNGGKIRSHYTFHGLRRDWDTLADIRKQTYTWAKNRRQRIQLKRSGLTGVRRSNTHKFLQQIEKLQRKLVDTRTYKGLGNRLRHRPTNFLTIVKEGKDRYSAKWDAERAKVWHDQKAQRKQLANIAGKYIKQDAEMFGKVKWAALYRELDAAGFKVTYTYGRQAGWKHAKSERAYLCSLPEFVGLQQRNPHKLYYGHEPDSVRVEQHKDELKAYAVAMREAANIKAEITTLQHMVASLQKQQSLIEGGEPCNAATA